MAKQRRRKKGRWVLWSIRCSGWDDRGEIEICDDCADEISMSIMATCPYVWFELSGSIGFSSRCRSQVRVERRSWITCGGSGDSSVFYWRYKRKVPWEFSAYGLHFVEQLSTGVCRVPDPRLHALHRGPYGLHHKVWPPGVIGRRATDNHVTLLPYG